MHTIKTMTMNSVAVHRVLLFGYLILMNLNVAQSKLSKKYNITEKFGGYYNFGRSLTPIGFPNTPIAKDDYSDDFAKSDTYESEIDFPTENDYFNNEYVSFTLNEPLCPRGATICEDVDNYPAQHIESVVSRESEKYEGLFGTDLVVTPEAVSNRFHDNDGDEELLCDSRETIIYPKTGLTQENTWMFIVNYKNYVQGVRVEICIHTKECSVSGGSELQFPIGYRARCKQKYIFRQLLAINSNGKTTKTLFQIPCCCECVIFKDDASNDTRV